MSVASRLLSLAVKEGEKLLVGDAEKVAAKKAPAVIVARSGTPKAVAQDVLQEAARPSKSRATFAVWRAANPGNGRVFDMSRLHEVPKVPQTQMARRVPPRGPSPRITDALASRKVAKQIKSTVERGIEGGGLTWYNTEPMRQRMAALGGDDAKYGRLMDIVAATSPRARVPDNVRTASYFNYLRENGLDIPDKPAGGYGSVAQDLHVGNVRGLDERGGWDIYRNPKPASFSTNLQGNQNNVTIDTHNFRLPGIVSQDPRFLETSINAGQRSGADEARAALSARYPQLPDEALDLAVSKIPQGKTGFTVYRPREWVDKGYMSPDDAAQDPVLWASKPNDNEYGYYENWQQKQAKKMGVSPAQYQAAMWLGGGEDTGLGSAAEPFLATFESRIRYTADALGMDPDKVADMVLRGEIPMLAKGGRVSRLAVRPRP